MLFEFAALLSSTALGSAVEVIAVPVDLSSAVRPAAVATAAVSSEQSAWARATDVGRPYLGPQDAPVLSTQRASERAALGPTDLSALRGSALLNGLASLSAERLSRALVVDPGIETRLRAAPPAAADVSLWWGGVASDSRAVLARQAPGLLGNLEGVPFGVRDQANRAYLDSTIAELTASLEAGRGRATDDRDRSTLHMLEQVRAALRQQSYGEPRRSLVSLDITGEGTAAIAVGSLAESEYISFLVPGMFFGVDARIDDWADTASVLVSEQEEWLSRLDRRDAEIASVAWIGYQTPTLLNVASMELARDGRDALTATLRGLAATRSDDTPYVSLLSHSYGSSAALLALQENDVEVDALAIVGSPGSPAATVDDLNVRGGNVFVGAAPWDPIPMSGAFGSQPLDPSYGARRMTVTGGIDPITGEALSGAVSHNDYFVVGSESMRNFALIGIGEEKLVTDGTPVSRAIAPAAPAGAAVSAGSAARTDPAARAASAVSVEGRSRTVS